MSQFQTIGLSRDHRGVATITLQRAEKRNALNGRAIGELREALTALNADDDVRAVVLAAEGDYFCAGADLAWLQDLARLDRPGRVAQIRELALLLKELDELSRPLVASVSGSAFGGGVGIVATCDSVVATPDARFALTEVRLGLIPATIGPYVVARIGPGAARRFILSARPIEAEEAVRIGLVSRVAPAPALEAALEDEVSHFLKGAPGAIAAAKAQFRRLAGAGGEELVAWTCDLLADQLEREEARRGLETFLAGGMPAWGGASKAARRPGSR